MAVITILAIHSTDEEPESVKPLVSLASDTGAHLNILILGVVKTIPTSSYPGLPDYYMADEYNRIIKNADARARVLEKLVGTYGVSVSMMVECCDRGMIGQTVSRYAMMADVTVFANGSIPKDPLATDAFNGIIFDSGRLVGILGPEAKPFTRARRVLMAWNGEPEAANAIHLSLPLLNEVKDVHLVMVDPEASPTSANPGDDMAVFLARHGLSVTVDQIASAGKEISEALLQHAMDKDADLIVMGAYGRSRLREWLLGGTTRSILAKAKIPVLMAH